MADIHLNVIDFATGQRREVDFDITDAILTNNADQTKWEGRLILSELGINYPAIYTLTFTALCKGKEDIKSVNSAICSDVNYVYNCLLEDIITDCDCCSNGGELSDNAIRNYLILYGHNAAMWQRDYTTAEEYFKILSRCFKNCGCSNKSVTKNCGCSK